MNIIMRFAVLQAEAADRLEAQAREAQAALAASEERCNGLQSEVSALSAKLKEQQAKHRVRSCPCCTISSPRFGEQAAVGLCDELLCQGSAIQGTHTCPEMGAAYACMSGVLYVRCPGPLLSRHDSFFWENWQIMSLICILTVPLCCTEPEGRAGQEAGGCAEG